jgi:hypothetical protein
MTETGQTKKYQADNFFRLLELLCFRDKGSFFLSGATAKPDNVQFVILSFGHCNLFEICYLRFVILIFVSSENWARYPEGS